MIFEQYTTSEKLRHYRESCAFSQQQVADALNINRSTYTKYETGVTEPNLDTIVKLAQLFNIPPQLLLPEKDDSSSRTYHDSITSVGSPVFQLSKDERGLLALYRCLPSDQKVEAKEMIANLAKKVLENASKIR